MNLIVSIYIIYTKSWDYNILSLEMIFIYTHFFRSGLATWLRLHRDGPLWRPLHDREILHPSSRQCRGSCRLQQFFGTAELSGTWNYTVVKVMFFSYWIVSTCCTCEVFHRPLSPNKLGWKPFSGCLDLVELHLSFYCLLQATLGDPEVSLVFGQIIEMFSVSISLNTGWVSYCWWKKSC